MRVFAVAPFRKVTNLIHLTIVLFVESFPQMCFEGKWLQNRLRADENKSRSLLAVDVQGHQRRGFCIVPIDYASSSLSPKCALRESGCRIGYDPTKMCRDHFWQSMSRDTNVEVSALSPLIMLRPVFISLRLTRYPLKPSKHC